MATSRSVELEKYFKKCIQNNTANKIFGVWTTGRVNRLTSNDKKG